VPGEEDPPDVELALLVVLRLLRDLAEHLDGRGTDTRADLTLRVKAVAQVIYRLRERLANGST
jgi:hypothetical protein